jgi:DeoR/GlpR family transcriptional regulator of sugar metabolism
MWLDRLQELRKQRIQSIAELIREAGSVNLREFSAKVSVEYGIRRRTLMEYLEDLQYMGKIRIEGDTVRWVGG